MHSEKKLKISFFARLFICFAVISIVPVAVLGTLTYIISSNVSLRNVEYQSSKTVNSATASLQKTIGEYRSALSYFCTERDTIQQISNSQVTPEQSTSIYQKMYILLAGKSSNVTMHLIKADGSFQVSTSVIPDSYNIREHRDWGIFRELNESYGTVMYSNHYVSPSGKSYCMAVANTIRKNGEIIAYAIIDIPSSVFQTALDTVNVSLPIRYSVVDGNNYFLYDEIFSGQDQIFMDVNFRNKMLQAQDSKKLYLENPKRIITWDVTAGDYPLRVMSSVPIELVVINSNYIMETAIAVALGAILLCVLIRRCWCAA